MHPFALKYVATCLLLIAGNAQAATIGEARALLDAEDGRAPAVIAALVKAEPKNADARVLLVRLLLSQGKAKSAVGIAQAAVALAPGNAQAHYWLGNAYGLRIAEVGMLAKMALAPKLRDAFGRAIAIDPGLVDARYKLVLYYLLAPAAIGGGADKARAEAAEIGKRDAGHGHLARGQILASEDKPTQALQAYEAAYAAKPGNDDIRMTLGIAYQHAGQWSKAHAVFDRWTRQDRRAAAAWYQIGRGAALSGDHLAEGILALEHYLALPKAHGNPEAQHAYLRLGQVHAHAGDPDRASVAWQAALKLDPGFDDAKAELAKL